jgi:cation diffusion facilitator CzcD-associated flavoprotein CzcO
MTTNADIVIVGAGAAGIAAARRLATSGFSPWKWRPELLRNKAA